MIAEASAAARQVAVVIAPKSMPVGWPNITPDRDTGIGRWTDNEIAAAVKTGLGRHGPQAILVMPWQAYSKISDDDTWAIVGYLRSLDPVEHQVPTDVSPGKSTNEDFVYFGVYRNRE